MAVARAAMRGMTTETLARRPLTTWALAAAACAMAALIPATAGAETLDDQICCGEFAIQSQELAASSDENMAVADDFTVPAGQTWSIGEVVSVWLAKDSDLANLPDVNLVIYADANSHPVAPLFTALGLAVQPAVLDEDEEIFAYEIPLAGVPTLGPGSYWLSLQARGDEATYGSWFWLDVGQSGRGAVLRNPGDGFETGCTEWALRTGCVLEGAAEPDQSFRLLGSRTVTPPPPPPGAAPTPRQPIPRVIVDGRPRTGRGGTLTISVRVSGPGVLSVSGTRLKRFRRRVSKAGRVRLTLRLNASGRKALRESKNGKLRVGVRIAFTPRGGGVATVTKRVTFSRTGTAGSARLARGSALFSRELRLR